MTRTQPELSDVANHEASHAVVWWWWVNRPGGTNDGTSGRFRRPVTIEPEDRRVQHGAFSPRSRSFDEGDAWEDWFPHFEHYAMTGLAGPVSDELRGQGFDLACTDFKKVMTVARNDFPRFGRSVADAEGAVQALRQSTMNMLQTREVRAMVSAVQRALIGHGTLQPGPAVEIMRSALHAIR